MQQRLGLGVALLGDPDLILLDEPTSALDPVGRTDVRAIVRAARDRGATVILNSHLLTEVERVCDRVIILHHGRTIASGSLDEVVASAGVRLQLDDPGEGARAIAAAFGPLAVEGDWLTVRPLAPRTGSRTSWRPSSRPADGSMPWSPGADRSKRGSSS